jgi:DNA-binding protein YbaB
METPFGPSASTAEVARLLGEIGAAAERPVTASADELVTVRANGSFQIEAVEIHASDLDPVLKRRVEHAVVAAVNAALSLAALKVGEALEALDARGR